MSDNEIKFRSTKPIDTQRTKRISDVQLETQEKGRIISTPPSPSQLSVCCTPPRSQISINIDDSDHWTSICCGNENVLDRHMMLFLCQVLFSMCMVVTCIYKLSLSDLEPSERTIYFSALTGTIATWSPAPRLHRND